MSDRIDYRVVSPDGYRGFGRLHHYLATSGLESTLIELVYLRVSQMNRCAYCVDLHSREALTSGVGQAKLNNLVTFAESPLFSSRERAALRWAESLTLASSNAASDAEYAEVRREFTDKELADLTCAIALINGFNRLGIAFRLAPDSVQ